MINEEDQYDATEFATCLVASAKVSTSNKAHMAVKYRKHGL